MDGDFSSYFNQLLGSAGLGSYTQYGQPFQPTMGIMNNPSTASSTTGTGASTTNNYNYPALASTAASSGAGNTTLNFNMPSASTASTTATQPTVKPITPTSAATTAPASNSAASNSSSSMGFVPTAGSQNDPMNAIANPYGVGYANTTPNGFGISAAGKSELQTYGF